MDVVQIFIDFQQSYDPIDRDFRIPEKTFED